MRILLDQNTPRGVRRILMGHDVRTAPEMGWAAYANGQLLDEIDTITAMMPQMKTVILIGTSHTYQRPGNPVESQLRKLITQACASSKIRAIAEEMSLEALLQKNVSESIGAEIAKILGLDHRYCDPDNEQRRVLNIRDEQNIRDEGFFVTGSQSGSSKK